MHLPASRCIAIPSHALRCTKEATLPLPFCSEHAAEHRALEEREKIAAREVERLRPVVEDLITDGPSSYTRVRDVRKDARVILLYKESLDEQISAAVALRARFFSKGATLEPAEPVAENRNSVRSYYSRRP